MTCWARENLLMGTTNLLQPICHNLYISLVESLNAGALVSLREIKDKSYPYPSWLFFRKFQSKLNLLNFKKNFGIYIGKAGNGMKILSSNEAIKSFPIPIHQKLYNLIKILNPL